MLSRQKLKILVRIIKWHQHLEAAYPIIYYFIYISLQPSNTISRFSTDYNPSLYHKNNVFGILLLCVVFSTDKERLRYDFFARSSELSAELIFR